MLKEYEWKKAEDKDSALNTEIKRIRDQRRQERERKTAARA